MFSIFFVYKKEVIIKIIWKKNKQVVILRLVEKIEICKMIWKWYGQINLIIRIRKQEGATIATPIMNLINYFNYDNCNG